MLQNMNMKQQQHFLPFSVVVLLFLLHCTTTLAQPAAAPAPPGPTNVTKILEKAGQFTLFIRLLKATSVSDQIDHQLNDTNNGMTLFAPTDNAFSSLSSGTLNSLNDQQKVALIQFHVIPTYIALSQFQTVSNPLRTNAGDSSRYKYPLNVTTFGNSVNVSSGITNTSVSGSVYSDGQLAVYQVDKVLLPWDLFGAKPPAPAPAPAKPKKRKADAVADAPEDAKVDNSSATSLMTTQTILFFGIAHAVVAAIFSL
ncbi:Fasciclin-like arabinogalactan protein [Melia azedarach]|uniref:Fasciclin-like arabinogalactan protein n=1 Tax=Melia azedarach TaxID=155640 RepID=A0ACC1YQF8_MELAZ|nr:Fasciclin-like arabinogalactan protein [Melia azedarach]